MSYSETIKWNKSYGPLTGGPALGTAGVGCSAKHFTTDGFHITTKLTVAGTMPAIAGGAALGVGLLGFTFPTGVHSLKVVGINLALQQTEGNVDADTPELSLGSVIVVGAVATMTTATWEDILTAQVMNDCDGTAEVKTLVSATAGHIVNEAAGVKAVFINIADTWAASGEALMGVDGTIWFEWTRLSGS